MFKKFCLLKKFYGGIKMKEFSKELQAEILTFCKENLFCDCERKVFCMILNDERKELKEFLQMLSQNAQVKKDPVIWNRLEKLRRKVSIL